MTDISVDDIIIYLRKSRSDDPALSVEEVLFKHEKDLQEYFMNEYGRHVPERNILREIVSGETIADRPLMIHLLKLLETNQYKAVAIIEPQRLTRGDLEDCGRVINSFRYTNTLIITPYRTFNLCSEYDRKFFEMELMRGNDYLEYTKKILNRGRIRSVKEGNFIGSFAPYGYRKISQIDSSGKKFFTLEIVPEEAEHIRMMYHLFVDEGYGFTNLAHYLDSVHAKPRKSDHWSPAALKDMIENPVYIGKIRWNYRKTKKIMVDGVITKTRPNSKNEEDYILVDGKHDAIIDEETFQKALDRRGKNPRLQKSAELRNPFAGLLYCGSCGRAMSYKECKDSRTSTGHISRSMLCNNQVHCHTKSVLYSAFFDRVISTLENTISDFEIKLQNDDGNVAALHQSIVSNLENELARLREKDLRQKDAFDDGIYTKEEYIHRNLIVQQQITETIEALEDARNSVPPVIDYQDKILRFRNCIDLLNDQTVSAANKNLVLKSCIEKIVYYNTMDTRAGHGRFIDNIFDIDIFLR